MNIAEDQNDLFHLFIIYLPFMFGSIQSLGHGPLGSVWGKGEVRGHGMILTD